MSTKVAVVQAPPVVHAPPAVQAPPTMQAPAPIHARQGRSITVPSTKELFVSSIASPPTALIRA